MTPVFATKHSTSTLPLQAIRILAGLLCASLLGGCGALRSYRAEMDKVIERTAGGDLPGAISVLEKNNTSDDKDLLFHMELGELKRLSNDFAGSFESFSKADAGVLAWEAAVKLDPTRAVGQTGSFLVNDRVRAYEGFDYEKVLITTRMAMGHLAMGDWDKARIEIKRTHEREALIAEVRSREYQKLREEASGRSAQVSFREINGYPVETLLTPEANALRNGYQNALSHYLAGFVYEALGEASLAAPGYRTAIELRPDQSALDDALAGLDARTGAPDETTCDTLFVIETGTIPGRQSRSFSLPIPIPAYGTFSYVQVSFPVLPAAQMGYQAPDIQIDGADSLPTAHILDLDAMARRALQDDMPGIMLRAFVRSATKAVAQYEIQRQLAQQRNRDDGIGAIVALLALQIGGAVVEQADERGWRTLPSQVTIARARLPRGTHPVSVRSDSGSARFEVNLAARHALVSIRLLRGHAFIAPAGMPGSPSPATAAGSGSSDLYAQIRVIDLPSSPRPWRTVQ
jgi:uncharacterized protein